LIYSTFIHKEKKEIMNNFWNKIYEKKDLRINDLCMQFIV
jgi:hypothetical protein